MKRPDKLFSPKKFTTTLQGILSISMFVESFTKSTDIYSIPLTVYLVFGSIKF